MADVTVSELRADMATAVNRVAFGKERLIVQRQGKALAALVPMEDIEALEAFEDGLWVELADVAVRDRARSIPLEELRQELGL